MSEATSILTAKTAVPIITVFGAVSIAVTLTSIALNRANSIEKHSEQLVAEAKKQTEILVKTTNDKLALLIEEHEKRLNDYDKVTTAILARMQAIEDSADIAYADRHSLTNMSEYALRLLIANPEMVIPDPRDPNRNMSINYRGPSP